MNKKIFALCLLASVLRAHADTTTETTNQVQQAKQTEADNSERQKAQLAKDQEFYNSLTPEEQKSWAAFWQTISDTLKNTQEQVSKEIALPANSVLLEKYIKFHNIPQINIALQFTVSPAGAQN